MMEETLARMIQATIFILLLIRPCATMVSLLAWEKRKVVGKPKMHQLAQNSSFFNRLFLICATELPGVMCMGRPSMTRSVLGF